MASRLLFGILLAGSLVWGQTPRTENQGPNQGPSRNRTSTGTSRRESVPTVPSTLPAGPENVLNPFDTTRTGIPSVGGARNEEEFLPFTNYRVGPEDLILVTVLDAPEFSRSVRINAEGAFRLPLVKQIIPASGKTTAELEQTIARVLLEEGLLREPSVSVTVREFQSKPVTVTGAVRSPIVFQALRPLPLSEALARAGGLSETAGPEILIAIPPSDGKTARKEVRVSAHNLLKMGDPDANLMLHGGEEVRVMPAGRVYIIGGVVKPGTVLLSDDRPLNLLQAVSLAGGPTPTAGRKAYLLRSSEPDPQRREIAFDFKTVMKQPDKNLVLQSNDVIFVPDSHLRRITQGGASAAASSFMYTIMGVLLWR
jgi:polysaccharide biosynthesis/export protein